MVDINSLCLAICVQQCSKHELPYCTIQVLRPSLKGGLLQYTIQKLHYISFVLSCYYFLFFLPCYILQFSIFSQVHFISTKSFDVHVKFGSTEKMCAQYD